MVRLIVAAVLSFAACVIVYWSLTLGSPEANRLVGFMPFLVIGIPFFVWLQGYLAQNGRRWYLVKAGHEYGPMSLRQLAAKKKLGEVSEDSLIRYKWSKQATKFEVLPRSPSRIAGGLVGIVGGAIAGGLIGYALFGQLSTSGSIGQGQWVQIEHVVEKPKVTPSYSGVTMNSFVDAAAESNIPGVREAGTAVQAPRLEVESALATYAQAIDKIRLAVVVGAVIGCITIASMMQETYSLVCARIVKPIPSNEKNGKVGSGKS